MRPAQFGSDGEAIFLGEHHVKDDHVVQVGLPVQDPLLPIVDHVDRVAVILQDTRKRRSQAPVVFDNQYLHASPFSNAFLWNRPHRCGVSLGHIVAAGFEIILKAFSCRLLDVGADCRVAFLQESAAVPKGVHEAPWRRFFRVPMFPEFPTRGAGRSLSASGFLARLRRFQGRGLVLSGLFQCGGIVFVSPLLRYRRGVACE